MGSPRASGERGLPLYRPSGRIGALLLPAGIPLSLVVAAAVAWVYQFLLDLGWDERWRWSLVLGYAFAAGVATIPALKVGKCRNRAAALAAGIVVGLGGVAASHYWCYLRFTPEMREAQEALLRQLATESAPSAPELPDDPILRDLAAALPPRSREEMMRRVEALHREAWGRLHGSTEERQRQWAQELPGIRNRLAAYSFGDYLRDRVDWGWSEVDRKGRGSFLGAGAFVWLIWVAEALLVAAGAAFVAGFGFGDPFCEQCRRWARRTDARHYPEVDGNALRKSAAAGQVGALLAPPPGGKATHDLTLTLLACPECDAGFLDASLDRHTPRRAAPRKGVWRRTSSSKT